MKRNKRSQSLLDEIKNDVGAVMEKVGNLRVRLGFDWSINAIHHFFTASKGSSIVDKLDTRIEEPNTVEITTSDHIIRNHQASPHSTNLPLGGGNTIVTGNIASRRGSRSTATPSPQLTASTDEEEVMMRALEEDNPVQITTSAGSTDTLHMNVEVNGAAPGEPVFASSFSSSPGPALVETVEVQHVEGILIVSSNSDSKLIVD